ncbi:hypothetical protein [Terrisporobacter vanillatitrophus]|uniref:hypothetical protein n=1 Tax=Terrisporobacter vanillatitrophus TaxID=3058402 RepID=UPI003367E684
MNKVTKTISISKDLDEIIQNIAKNFFNNNYSVTLESIIRAADESNIEISQDGQLMNIHSLKVAPSGMNSIDLTRFPYNGSDSKFRANCSSNFSPLLQTAIFKMISVIIKYSYQNYNTYNVNHKHFIGFKENVSIYQINTDGSLNHGVYINSLLTLGSSQKTPRDYIESNYYPEKSDRSFIFISLTELNNIEANETVFISHLERFTRSNNFFNDNDLWNHIKKSLGLLGTTVSNLPSHIEDYLINKYTNVNFNLNNKNIEALELSIEDIYTVINYFENLL